MASPEGKGGNIWVTIVTSITDIIKRAIPWGGSVAIVYFLAGRSTNVNFLADIVAKFSADKWAAWFLVAAASGWAVAERTLKRRTIARYSPRVKELETELNQWRRSSGLRPTGETSDED
jgi:hypothetical protein